MFGVRAIGGDLQVIKGANADLTPYAKKTALAQKATKAELAALIHVIAVTQAEYDALDNAAKANLKVLYVIRNG